MEFLCLSDTHGKHRHSGVTIEGINIWGSPETPRFYDWSFNRDQGKVIDKHWKRIPANTDILVTHGPPAGILDEVGLNNNAGCEDLLRHVKRINLSFTSLATYMALMVVIKQQISSISMQVSPINRSVSISVISPRLLKVILKNRESSLYLKVNSAVFELIGCHCNRSLGNKLVGYKILSPSQRS